MNHFVIADSEKCIGCRTCEIACVMSHLDASEHPSLTLNTFLPRIHVIKNGDISTATLCRQCDDAACANVCPNHAIVQEQGFLHVIQERCIGCKTCVVACPYGAMTVVMRPHSRTAVADLHARGERAEALKCDLCYQREQGPACLEACPTQAIIMVNAGADPAAPERRHDAIGA